MAQNKESGSLSRFVIKLCVPSRVSTVRLAARIERYELIESDEMDVGAVSALRARCW
jgi:hypothetical protein